MAKVEKVTLFADEFIRFSFMLMSYRMRYKQQSIKEQCTKICSVCYYILTPHTGPLQQNSVMELFKDIK